MSTAGARPAYVLVRTCDLRVGPEIVEYIGSVDPTLEQYGAEILVQDYPAQHLEGAWDGFLTMLRFPDIAAATAWYDSPGYRAIRGLRQRSSTPTAALFEGVRAGHRSSDLLELFGLR